MTVPFSRRNAVKMMKRKEKKGGSWHWDHSCVEQHSVLCIPSCWELIARSIPNVQNSLALEYCSTTDFHSGHSFSHWDVSWITNNRLIYWCINSNNWFWYKECLTAWIIKYQKSLFTDQAMEWTWLLIFCDNTVGSISYSESLFAKLAPRLLLIYLRITVKCAKQTNKALLETLT